jgi:hypothetical protein
MLQEFPLFPFFLLLFVCVLLTAAPYGRTEFFPAKLDSALPRRMAFGTVNEPVRFV